MKNTVLAAALDAGEVFEGGGDIGAAWSKGAR